MLDLAGNTARSLAVLEEIAPDLIDNLPNDLIYLALVESLSAIFRFIAIGHAIPPKPRTTNYISAVNPNLRSSSSCNPTSQG